MPAVSRRSSSPNLIMKIWHLHALFNSSFSLRTISSVVFVGRQFPILLPFVSQSRSFVLSTDYSYPFHSALDDD